MLLLTLTKTVEDKNKVIKTWGKTHDFYLMSLNDPNSKYPLYAIRSRRRGMNHAIQNLRLKHPQASIMYQWFNFPNQVIISNFGFTIVSSKIHCLTCLETAVQVDGVGDIEPLVHDAGMWMLQSKILNSMIHTSSSASNCIEWVLCIRIIETH